MLRGLYDWTLAKCRHPQAERWLAGISFAEASFFPIPPDVLLAPMCLADPARAFRYAAITTIASVAGAILGYLIGMFLFEGVGKPILQFYGGMDAFNRFKDAFNEQGWLVVLLAGFTPIPFKVVTITAGATAMPLFILVAGSILARAARFFLVAGLLWQFGPPMQVFIERHFNLLSLLFGVLLVGGFVVVGLLAR
jgi:membrane protein YqaA with SNARE-associated domain